MKLKPNNCPNCGRILDAATGIDGGDIPSPKDITICMYCATVLTYTEDMTLIKCTPHVIRSLSLGTLLLIDVATKAINSMKKPNDKQRQ